MDEAEADRLVRDISIHALFAEGDMALSLLGKQAIKISIHALFAEGDRRRPA